MRIAVGGAGILTLERKGRRRREQRTCIISKAQELNFAANFCYRGAVYFGRERIAKVASVVVVAYKIRAALLDAFKIKFYV